MSLRDGGRILRTDRGCPDLLVYAVRYDLKMRLRGRRYLASRFPADQAMVMLTAVSSSPDSNKATTLAELTFATAGTTSLYCGFSTNVLCGDL